jgi:hypothetical protein
VEGVADYHINADEPSVLDYNMDFKTTDLISSLYAPDQFRTSDHDPVVIGLNPVNNPPSADAGGPYSVYEGGSVALSATGVDPEDGSNVTFAWDLDNNGSFETPGQNVNFSAAELTAPAVVTVKVQVTDTYGNSAVDETTINVLFNFTGFFAPIDNAPTFNVVKAGQSIPVKFSLGGYHGLNIIATGYPVSQQVACDFSNVDSIEETITAGASALTYDSDTDQYHYVWKTNKAWAGTCRQLTVQLTDGTTHIANFFFK